MDLAILRTELLTDPLGRAYSGMADAQAVTSLNTANRSVARDVVAAWEVWEAIVPAEWAGLSAAEKQRIQTMLGMGTLSVKGANTRAAFMAVFGAGATRTALAALQTTTTTRAAELGLNTVTALDVSRARLGTW